jgi:outer membrane protein assembly factor BamB
MLVDADVNSYLLAVSAKDGKQIWKTPRTGVTHGFTTPVLYEPKTGAKQVIVSGSYNLVSYSVDTGEKLWWVGGMAWQAKSTPVIQGDTVYVHSWMADMTGLGLPKDIASFDEVIKTSDKDGDGKLASAEIPYDEMRKLMFLFDLNHDKFIDREEWDAMLARNTAKNGVYAVKIDGKRGDVSSTNVLWRYDKAMPNIPSPLYYQNVLYILREGGILTSVNPANGEIIKQGRVKDATDGYFASPVAADGKIFLMSEGCKFSVLKAAGEWDVLGVYDFDESECRATPAIVGNAVYIRTHSALYAFAKKA